ncbi:MAG: CBS domain-containing protein [Proteobacteria bacterium]|nr:CBS domain-containing protein [Pseudomonadota bacterium]
MKIREIRVNLKGRDIPTVLESTFIKEVIETMHCCPHSHLVYVVNESDELTGTISLGTIMRQVLCHKYEPKVHPRTILGMVTYETARDIMHKKPTVATEEEEVELVIKRMIDANVKEIAIISDEKKIIADVTILDLLKMLGDI